MKRWIMSLFLLFQLFPALAFSQQIYFPYYGKNKILFEKFSWRTYPTEHFEIYFYIEHPQILKNVAEVAESAYQKISQLLKHQLSEPIPLIYYATYTDFEQTNLFQISEGVLGVAEPVLHRIAIHGDMSLDEFQSTLEHELTHIFEFDILWGSPGGALYAVTFPPLWIFEGFAEYNTKKWSPWSTLILRDAVLNDRIPELTESGELFSRYPLPRDPAYDFGHAIYEFIESKYGANGIREFWLSMKNSPFFGRQDPLKKAFNMKYKEFNFEFKKFLRDKVKDFLTRENPENYSMPLGPEFPINPYYFSFSHALSPSGDIIAALTYNTRDNDIDIVLISSKDGSVIKNITRGLTTKYEYIKYEIDPSKGRDLAWSPDGDRLAFFARDGQKYSLFIVEALSGKTIKKIKTTVDQPCSPCFLPSGEEIFFTGFEKGNHDLFQMNLASGEVRNLTNDSLFEKAPAVSPDGKFLAYTIRVDVYDKLFISSLSNIHKRTQLTFGMGNNISPEFSPDSKEIFFSGDMRDAFNIYSLNLETGILRRYTDVRTGNFFPSPLPGEPRKIIFSSFNKGSFQVFKGEFEAVVEGTISFSQWQSEEKIKGFEPILAFEIDKDKVKPYNAFDKLFLTSKPPVDAIVATDGSIYGGSAVSFSDILGDHSLYALAYQVRSFRSYYFAYIKQSRRFQYLASAFQYTLFYYPPYAYYDPVFYNYLSYRDAIASRKISGLTFSAYYPINKYYRTELGIGLYHYEEDFLDPFTLSMYSTNMYSYFWNGNILSASFSLVGETTHFKYYGPAAGHTFRISLSPAIPVTSSFFSNFTVEADLRKYINLGADFVLAFRWEGFASRGRDPYVFYFGGNNQVRSSYYLNIIANEGWYANAEFRFPVINAASTIIGQIGPVRGVAFFDIARAKIKGFPAKFARYEIKYKDPPDPKNPYEIKTIEYDAIGSYGYGLQFFFLGLPIHLEFVKSLEFPKMSRPYDFQVVGKFRTVFWIGYDF